MTYNEKIIKLLKEMIDNELEEVAVSSEIASSQKLALMIIEKGNRKTFILYKPFQIFGMLLMRYKSECGAYEVSMSAAESGFGPLMYHAGMSINGPNYLMPDRTMISDEALNVWKKFYSRNDVTKELLPKQCQYKMVDKNSKILNFKYTLQNPISFSELLKQNDEYIQNSKNFNKTEEEFKDKIHKLGMNFFSVKYND